MGERKRGKKIGKNIKQGRISKKFKGGGEDFSQWP